MRRLGLGWAGGIGRRKGDLICLGVGVKVGIVEKGIGIVLEVVWRLVLWGRVIIVGEKRRI